MAIPKPKNSNMNMIINQLIDAVVASGKKLEEIGKDPIFKFLEKQGIPKPEWGNIYDDLKKSMGIKDKSKKSDVQVEQKVVDYSDNSHNDVKVRQPRKSVFSEIKKLAG